jgi:hypothetical protein
MKSGSKNINLKPKPKGQRPRCLYCTKELDPQFITEAMPPDLADGRRRTQREAWVKGHPEQFTGDYGRFRDSLFCGASCGYNWAVAHAKKTTRKRA